MSASSGDFKLTWVILVVEPQLGAKRDGESRASRSGEDTLGGRGEGSEFAGVRVLSDALVAVVAGSPSSGLGLCAAAVASLTSHCRVSWVCGWWGGKVQSRCSPGTMMLIRAPLVGHASSPPPTGTSTCNCRASTGGRGRLGAVTCGNGCQYSRLARGWPSLRAGIPGGPPWEMFIPVRATPNSQRARALNCRRRLRMSI